VAVRSKARNAFTPQTLGSWVWIPFVAWMSVCVYSVFVLSCVGSGLATGWSPVQGVLPTVSKIQTLELINSEWVQARESNQSSKREKKIVLSYLQFSLVSRHFTVARILHMRAAGCILHLDFSAVPCCVPFGERQRQWTAANKKYWNDTAVSVSYSEVEFWSEFSVWMFYIYVPLWN
jgi:hypothetical protein